MNNIVDNCLEIAKKYRHEGYHCSETVIRAINEAFNLDLSKDIIRSACGYRGGGGGYYDRCGIIDTGILIISYLYGRDDNSKEAWTYSYLIRILHERFKAEFKSLYCRDIMLPQKEKGLENICFEVSFIGIRIIAELLLEADELIKNAPIVERN